MGILFTTSMGFLFTITIGILFTMVLGIQFTISTGGGNRWGHISNCFTQPEGYGYLNNLIIC